MARGRFLDKRITQDMRFTRVSANAYLVYLCITPHLAASVVYSAASERHDNNGALSYYARLMKGSFYRPARGPGLFSPVDNVPSEVPDKYRVLTDVMRP